MLKDKRRLKKALLIVTISLIIAILAHSYYILQYPSGKLMKGINDGLSQMIPYKYFLFENYSVGNFFYSESFGIGGGIFSQLAYYYSTNIFYLIVAFILFAIQSLLGVDVNFNTWIALILPMSIMKMTLIIVVAYRYFKIMSLSSKASYIGAIVYGVSPFFLRHEMYWDFFSDAMFWMMLLFIGIEKIIRKQSGIVFTIAVACTVINNFYFAYINLLLAFFYILIRWLIKASNDELGYMKQLKSYLIGGLLGFGIGSFAFVPAVVGYLNNFRPNYKDPFPIIAFTDNILLNSRVIWLPIFVVIVLCMKKLYNSKTFQVFALLAILGTVLHFVPYVGSVFNGFSAPQNRWESIVILGYAGVTAYGIDYLKEWKAKQIVIGCAVFTSLAVLSFLVDSSFKFKDWVDYTLPVMSVVLVVIYLVLVKTKKVSYASIGIVTILFVVAYLNIFQMNRLAPVAKDSHAPTFEFMASDLYNSKEQQALISEAKKELQEGARIDWMAYIRNNTPIVQNFDGVSVYSSILNKNILNLYHEDLQIDMGRESVSRYASFGARANLMSLLQVEYYMRGTEDTSIPYNYEPFSESENYIMYKNEQLLPPFRIVNQFISESSLEEAPILQREHAMLMGAILEKKASNNSISGKPISQIHPLEIQYNNATLEKGILSVTKSEGGLDLYVSPSSENVKDYYVSFSIEGVKKSKEFSLKVNEYETTRKESKSIYRTNVNDLTVRVKASPIITFRLPKGNYKLSNIKIYEEDYDTLNEALKNSKEAEIQWEDDLAKGVVVATSNNEMVITPIPFEPGWELKVNGEKTKIKKVNYAFIGIPLKKGINDIELSYFPPFFKQCVLISMLSIIILFVAFLRQRTKKDKRLWNHF